MIRILHVIHGMDCGGTENIIMNLYRNIDKKKVQFDFLVHTKKDCFFDDEIKVLGGKIYRVPYYTIYNILSYRESLHSLFSTHKEWSVVHGHLGSCACIYLSVAKKYGLYTIAHSHAINDKKINLKVLLYRFHAYLSRGVANFYMGCSYESGVDRYGKRIAGSNKFHVINNGINAKQYVFNPTIRNQVRLEFGIEEKYIIGHVGRFNLVKNHKFMVSVLAELLKIKSDYVMMFVGDGELKEDVYNQAMELGIIDNIIFTGIRKDVPNVLQAMDQFIFPSFNEGLGIGLIEAQASGLPCVANKDGIIPLAKISPLVEFISLEDGTTKWAKHIDNIRRTSPVRNNMYKIVCDSGFDIIGVAKWLENFYLNCL